MAISSLLSSQKIPYLWLTMSLKYLHKLSLLSPKCAPLAALFVAVFGFALSLAVSASASPEGPKNVIVMINDGAGWGTWDATAYWQYGSREALPYADFLHYGMTTYPLNTSRVPTRDPASLVGYDPDQAWDTTPIDNEVLPFVGYRYLATNPTDSAAAGTALSSGVKTYWTAVNTDNYGQPLVFSALVAKRTGRAAGVVTSVPFPHATPAAFAAQSLSRSNYRQIAHQMLTEGHLDVIMGTAGARGYDINGQPYKPMTTHEWAAVRKESLHYVVEDADWELLEAGNYLAQGETHPWQLIRDKSAFDALAEGSLAPVGPLIGVPNVATTLQFSRNAAVVGEDSSNPSGVAYIESVPTLATMTTGALKHLARRSDVGFFLMIEGGATDWAAHTSAQPAPEYGRLIEETLDFNNAIQAVIDWVEANSSWDETLLIITTDHGNGAPFGPDAQTVPFQPVTNNGKGVMPGISFRKTGHHTNALVPLWIKGAGSEQFARRVRGVDPGYAKHVRWNDGSYVDNTDVAKVTMAVMEGREVEPFAE